MFSYTTKPLGLQQASLSATDFNSRKNRALSTAGNFKHKEVTINRLPELSRSSSTTKSAKLKLTTLEATLSSVTEDLEYLKTQTRSRRYCNFLREELGSSQLGLIHLELRNAANKLDKLFRRQKQQDQERSQLIKVKCDRLREGSKKLGKAMDLLRSRLDRCEGVMGVSSGKQKHLK